MPTVRKPALRGRRLILALWRLVRIYWTSPDARWGLSEPRSLANEAGRSSAGICSKAGRIRSNIDAQEALTAQLRERYENTVLRNLEEVENGLVSFVQEQQRRDARDLIGVYRALGGGWAP